MEKNDYCYNNNSVTDVVDSCSSATPSLVAADFDSGLNCSGSFLLSSGTAIELAVGLKPRNKKKRVFLVVLTDGVVESAQPVNDDDEDLLSVMEDNLAADLRFMQAQLLAWHSSYKSNARFMKLLKTFRIGGDVRDMQMYVVRPGEDMKRLSDLVAVLESA